MAVVPKIALVATKDDLEEEIHMFLGSKCEHSKIAPTCKVIAIGLMSSKVIQTVPEFMKRISDHEEVRQILMDAMAGAWAEGHFDCISPTCTCPNPYKPDEVPL